MREHYDGWQKASHHAAATCNGCHVPHGFAAKWASKALNGFHHSRAFTFQDFAEPIRIKPGNADVLAANCLRCHGDLVRDIIGRRTAGGKRPDCVRCHADVGHGPSR
jgi:cytochrome c nitrite reductase small subunit